MKVAAGGTRIRALISLPAFLLTALPAYSAYILEQLVVLPEGSARVVRALNDDDEAVGSGTVRNKHQGLRLKRDSVTQIEGSPGTDYSVAHGINAVGEVVGSANTGKAVRAFRAGRQSQAIALAPLPGDTGSEAFAINRQGEVVGYSSGAAGVRAVLWSNANVIKALPNLSGSGSSKAMAINNSNDAVGVSVVSSNPRATLWSGAGSVENLGVLPGHQESEALAINDSGEIAGSSGVNGVNRRAVRWDENGIIEDLGTLEGGLTSRALGINDRGEIVGVSHTARGNQAFIWTRAAGMQNLNRLVIGLAGFVLTDALAVNNRGVILAIGQQEIDHVEEEGHTHDLHELPVHVFLLRPAP